VGSLDLEKVRTKPVLAFNGSKEFFYPEPTHIIMLNFKNLIL